MDSHLILIIGASASGKSTFARSLLQSGNYYTVKSLMTRPRRGDDKDEEVKFITEEQFKTLINANQLMEFEEFHGNYYGTSKSEIQSINKNSLSIKVIDPRGAQSIIDHLVDTTNIKIHLVLVRSPMHIIFERLLIRNDEQSRSRRDGVSQEMVDCSNLWNSYKDNPKVDRVLIPGDKKLPLSIEFTTSPTHRIKTSGT